MTAGENRLPRLNRARVSELLRTGERRADPELPTRAMLDLPERVVQFGTGGFLRGFVDYFIDDANRRGLFAGRVVAVASTAHGTGRHRGLEEQDGLYTLVTRGESSDTPARVIAAISRVISAASDWGSVLATARAPELELVFSNTTEVGIAAHADDAADASPPRSFPGKLTRFLYERAQACDFDAKRGLAIVPCELIEANGDRLREAVVATARRWKLGTPFMRWLDAAVPFCNTLVDRIVPSLSDDVERRRLETQLGYADRLITMCEPYRLFAIQADDRARRRLAFTATDPAILLCDDVTPYRERKLRLLNGTHTVMASIGLLAGHRFVNEAMSNGIGDLVRRAMHDEIVPCLDVPDAAGYAREVLARFANPAIHHELLDIMLHATTKMRVRVVPMILSYARAKQTPPPALSLGFGALLHCFRGDLDAAAERAGRTAPQDDNAARIRAVWRSTGGGEAETVARQVIADATLWGGELAQVSGFVPLVAEQLSTIAKDGVRCAIARVTGEGREVVAVRG